MRNSCCVHCVCYRCFLGERPAKVPNFRVSILIVRIQGSPTLSRLSYGHQLGRNEDGIALKTEGAGRVFFYRTSGEQLNNNENTGRFPEYLHPSETVAVHTNKENIALRGLRIEFLYIFYIIKRALLSLRRTGKASTRYGRRTPNLPPPRPKAFPSFSFSEASRKVAGIGKIQTLNRAHPRVLRLPILFFSSWEAHPCLPMLSPSRFFPHFSQTFFLDFSLRSDLDIAPRLRS